MCDSCESVERNVPRRATVESSNDLVNDPWSALAHFTVQKSTQRGLTRFHKLRAKDCVTGHTSPDPHDAASHLLISGVLIVNGVQLPLNACEIGVNLLYRASRSHIYTRQDGSASVHRAMAGYYLGG